MIIDGSDPDSYPSLGDIILNTNGRKNPARTVAEECIPGVPEKISIVNPVKKDKISNIHEGISTGRRRMNIIYMYGFTYPLN